MRTACRAATTERRANLSLPYGCAAGDIEAPVRFSPHEHGVGATVGVGRNDGCTATERVRPPSATSCWVNVLQRVWCSGSVGFQPDAKVTGRVFAPDWPPSTGLRTGLDTTFGLSPSAVLRTRLRVRPAVLGGKPAEAGSVEAPDGVPQHVGAGLRPAPTRATVGVGWNNGCTAG